MKIIIGLSIILFSGSCSFEIHRKYCFYDKHSNIEYTLKLDTFSNRYTYEASAELLGGTIHGDYEIKNNKLYTARPQEVKSWRVPILLATKPIKHVLSDNQRS